MGVTMIYYLIAFPLFVLGYYTPSESVDAMTNLLIFSLAGLLTGIVSYLERLFCLSARTLQKESDLRYHMIMATYGFLLFYIAGSALASQASLSSIWISICILYWIIVLSNLFRALFFSCYGISGRRLTPFNQKICN